MKLMIRADDLGYSNGINKGIAETVKCGLVKTVGLIVNLPPSKKGFDMVKAYDLCLGLHINLTVGKPLLKPSLIPSITSESGILLPSSVYRTSPDDFVILDEVILEIEAQYKAFLKITNRKPDYIEVHAIQNQTVAIGCKMVALKYGLLFSPFPVKSDRFTIRGIPFDVCMEPMKQDYDPYQSLQSFLHESDCDYGMFVVHPGYVDQYLLQHSSLTTARELELKMLCSKRSKELLDKQNVELITYRTL